MLSCFKWYASKITRIVFTRFSTVNKMWAYFYQCHMRLRWRWARKRRRQRQKEAPYFKFLYFEKWWRCICVQDLGRVSINHFLPQNLCNYFCIGYANTGLIKTGMKIFWILFVFWVIMMRENLRIYQFAL